MAAPAKAPEVPTFRLASPAQLKIGFVNPVARLQFRDDMVTNGRGESEGPDSKFAIQLVETSDDSVILDAPRNACDQGDEVQLELTTKGLKDDLKLQILAKVASQKFESHASDRGTITLSFLKFDEQQWRKLRDAFAKRQTDVIRVLEALKG